MNRIISNIIKTQNYELLQAYISHLYNYRSLYYKNYTIEHIFSIINNYLEIFINDNIKKTYIITKLNSYIYDNIIIFYYCLDFNKRITKNSNNNTNIYFYNSNYYYFKNYKNNKIINTSFYRLIYNIYYKETIIYYIKYKIYYLLNSKQNRSSKTYYLAPGLLITKKICLYYSYIYLFI